MLSIKNLTVSVKDKIILKDFNLEINDNEIHSLMGLNGSGKSTICKVLMGDPTYKVDEGSIFYKDVDLLKLYTIKTKNGRIIIVQTYI